MPSALFCLIWTLLLQIHLIKAAGPEDPEFKGEFCDGDTVSVNCPQGYLATIDKVFWGREDTTTCVKENDPTPTETNCKSTTAFDVIDKACKKKNKCSVQVSSAVLGEPCKGVSKYLIINYSCSLPVFSSLTCEDSKVGLECPYNNIMRIESAFWGRSEADTCKPETDQFSTSCSQGNVKERLEEFCNYRTKCTFQAIPSMLGQPCEDTYKYLLVSYVCAECKNLEEDTTCDKYRGWGECERNPKWMMPNCRKSCWQCAGADTCINTYSGVATKCDKWAGEGECHINPDFMTKRCRKSCNRCLVCADFLDDCEQRVSERECSWNEKYMRVNCRLACGFCEAPVTPAPTEDPNKVTDLVDLTTAEPDNTTPDPFAEITLVACEGDIAHAQCEEGQYLVILDIAFGRLSREICPHESVFKTDCKFEQAAYGEAMTSVRTLCNGRLECQVDSNTRLWGDTCPGTYKYLELKYTCQNMDKCVDRRSSAKCEDWEENGRCKWDHDFMYENCQKTCFKCDHENCPNIHSPDIDCEFWAVLGECTKNLDWMTDNCGRSCRACPERVMPTTPDMWTTAVTTAEPVQTTDTVDTTGTDPPVTLTPRDTTISVTTAPDATTPEIPQCPGKTPCNDRGVCTASLTCECDEGWTGKACTRFSCAEVNNCWGRGRCIGPNECRCFPYYSGSDCLTCDTTFSTGPSCLPCPKCVEGDCSFGTKNRVSYVGCYADDPASPDFDKLQWENQKTNPKRCMEQCHKRGFLYAALQNGSSCYCGNQYGKYGESTDCDIQCQGSRKDICGGVLANNVYRVDEGKCECPVNREGRRCARCSEGFSGQACTPDDNVVTIGPGPTFAQHTTTFVLPTDVTSEESVTTKRIPAETTSADSDVTSDSPITATPEETQTTSHDLTTPAVTTQTEPPEQTTQTSVTTPPPAPTNVLAQMEVAVNEEWKEEYSDMSNSITKQKVAEIRSELDSLYQEAVPGFKSVQIEGLRQGSVIVEHTVEAEPTGDITNDVMIRCEIVKHLPSTSSSSSMQIISTSAVKRDKCSDGTVICDNGGESVARDDGTVSCDCEVAYEGRYCEIRVWDATVVVLVIVIGVTVPLLLIVLVCVVLVRLKKEEGKNPLSASSRTFRFQGIPTTMSTAKKGIGNKDLTGTRNQRLDEGFYLPRRI